MRKFMDTLKVEQKLKKHKSQRQVDDSQMSAMEQERTELREQDDISKFINMVIEDHNATELDKL